MVASGLIPEMRPFFLGPYGNISGVLVVACLGFILVQRRKLRPGEQIWLIISVIVLSRLGRFAPVFALAAAPQLAVVLPRLSDKPMGQPIIRWGLATVLLGWLARLVMLFPEPSMPLEAWLNRFGPSVVGYPCAACNFVMGRAPGQTGRLISEFSWGGYMEWRLGDRYQVLLDGRTQLFTPEFWQATYLGGVDKRRQFLATVNSDAAVIHAEGSMFRHALVQNGWKTAYRDQWAEVMVPPAPVAVKPPTEEPLWRLARWAQ